MAFNRTLEMVRRIQLAMGTAYAGAGALCLCFPSTILAISLTPQYAIINRTSTILMQCFGAQAATSGLLLAVSDMTVTSFTAFGLAMIPYLGFNAWFLAGPGRGMFTPWLYADLLGNITFLTGSLFAAKLLREAEEQKKAKAL